MKLRAMYFLWPVIIVGVLLLYGCSTVPAKAPHLDVKFRFVCTPDDTLLVGAFINDDEEPYAAVVGKCIGDLKLVAPPRAPQTSTNWKIS